NGGQGGSGRASGGTPGTLPATAPDLRLASSALSTDTNVAAAAIGRAAAIFPRTAGARPTNKGKCIIATGRAGCHRLFRETLSTRRRAYGRPPRVIAPLPVVPSLSGAGCPLGRSSGSTARVAQCRARDGKRGATVEGVNIGGILLGYLGILVLG